MANYETPKIGDKSARELPDYEEKFGHLAEKIIRSAIGKREAVVEKVEAGTKIDDQIGKVDFWMKLIGMEDPLGIQYTTNPEKYEEKKKLLRSRNNLAKKEKRPGAEIEWEGNANVIVILGDHAKMIGYWKKIEQEGAKMEDVVSDAFVVNFFFQVSQELKLVNPAKFFIVMGLFMDAKKRVDKEKRKTGR